MRYYAGVDVINVVKTPFNINCSVRQLEVVHVVIDGSLIDVNAASFVFDDGASAGYFGSIDDAVNKKDDKHIGHKKRIWERWERILFGFRLSPYIYTQRYYWGEEIIRRDRR